MNLKILLDMNLSPHWVSIFMKYGWTSIHWYTVGDHRATDRTIMEWALKNDYIVFTYDLDFGTMLALTHATGPSVIQIRGKDILSENIEKLVITALRQYETELEAGALVVIDENTNRVRILPIK